ncbi:replicative DNA helicase [Calorimonas adulescens]|uniref:Replicative DNA helicase n=1 Tax=Calorimonas adulescens TaxID=2606906 RepID=A0A5D8QBF0_9THEO|nr:replicative DNA helicase [Calorimonas adulescens]TZE80853.1 replicative DNA helicase [Calorimonas adulescens]
MEAIGRVPPHSIEAEVSVLGAMMLDKEAVVEASEIITRDDFYRDSHKILFDVMMELFEKGEPVDLVTVIDALRSKNLLEVVGGQDYVSELPMGVVSTTTVPYYAKMIKDKATLRRLIEASGRVVELGFNGGSVDEVLDEAERSIFMISESRTTSGFLSVRDILPESLEMIDRLQKNKGSISGVPSGYSDLDNKTSGFQPSDLVLIAARPSMGKTAFALNIAHNAAIRHKKSVAIFSLEMSKEQLTNRLICSEATIDSQKLRMGMLDDEDWPKLTRAVGVLSQAPIYIDDTPNITISEMRGKLRRLKMEKGLDMVIIDYLQLMQSEKKAESRQQEISNLTRALKGLARELNVPIITLSQLSRAPEARSDHRPMLSDLRECVTGDTLVMLADGTRVPVKDLVGAKPEVFSVDQRGRIIKARSDMVWYVGKRPVFDVILASGRHIRATSKHHLLSGSGWKQVSELTVGDRIACARRIPEPQNTESWSEYRVALLGQLIGDGSSHYRFAPSRELVAQYAEILNDELLRDAATNDLFWDRIIQILPCGEEDVYDLTVPATSSWLADGIVSHNSGAIEQDADVVMFLYREDYYEPETDRKNITEVIIAKQRNGPTGTIELYWLPQYTRFVGLEKARQE